MKLYSHAVTDYLRICRLILILPNDIKIYILEYLDDEIMSTFKYLIRSHLLNSRPSLYLLNKASQLNEETKYNICVYFNGLRCNIKVNKQNTPDLSPTFTICDKPVKKTGLHNIVLSKNIEPSYSTYFQKSSNKIKMNKKEYLSRNLKRDKTLTLDRKKKDRLLSLKKKYSSRFKDIQFESSVFVDDEVEYNKFIDEEIERDYLEEDRRYKEYMEEYYEEYYDDYDFDYYEDYYGLHLR
jgi:hypothetical protein